MIPTEVCNTRKHRKLLIAVIQYNFAVCIESIEEESI